MDETTFFYIALVTHLTIVAGALLIKDIATIFNFIGAFCVTFVLFFFPSVIFLQMMHKFGKMRHHDSAEYFFYKVIAYTLILMGVVTFSLETYANIQNLREEEVAGNLQ